MGGILDPVADVNDRERKQVAVSASFVALGTTTSRVTGFLRDILIYHYFSRTATDAFVVAFRLPNLFRRLFGEGALTVSFIPVFSDFIKNEDKKEARELVSAVFTLLFAILSVLTLLGTWGAEPIVTALTSGKGFTDVPGKLELTVHQARIMFCYVFLVSMYAFFMGILNTLRVFWLPAVAPAIWNITVIVGTLFFRDTFAVPSDVLAWATVFGGVLQAGLLVIPLHRRGYLPKFVNWLGSPGVKKVLKGMLPAILGLSVMQLGVIINTYFASRLEEGSNSWIFLADRILEFPLSIFAVSLGTVALPTLSGYWSRGDRKGMSEASLHALKLALFMAIPCAAGLYVLAVPIVRALFEHGRFSAYDTQMTASVIRVYGLGVVFAAGVRVLAPAFYAMKNTWVPALSAMTALICHVFIANILMERFGVVGLAMSSVISAGINFSILIGLYQVQVARLRLLQVILPVAKFTLAALLMAIAARYYPVLEGFFGDSHVGRAATLLVTVFLSGMVYFVAGLILRTEELTETFGEFQKRLSRRLKR